MVPNLNMKAIHQHIDQHYSYDDGILVQYHNQHDMKIDIGPDHGLARTTITWWLGKKEVFVFYYPTKIAVSAVRETSYHIPLADPNMIDKMMDQIYKLLG
jgi:hypothetical protein